MSLRATASSSATKTASPPGDRKRTFTNSVAGEQMTITSFSSETGGMSTKVRVLCQPGGGPSLHWHRTYTEHFFAAKGPLTLERDGVRTVLQPGGDALVARGVRHRFTNETDHPIELDVVLRPGQPGFEKSLVVFYGLAEDGLADATGFPASIVHDAIGSKLGDIWFPGVYGALLNAANSVLSAYARWTGIEKELIDKYYYGAGFVD